MRHVDEEPKADRRITQRRRPLHLVLALIVALGFGPGVGLALIGAWRRALAWLVAALLCMVAATWLPHLLLVLGAIVIGSIVDTLRTALRTTGLHWWKALPVMAASVAVGVGVRAVVVEEFATQSSSMAPTLLPGDRFFVDKLSSLWAAPARGELVAFRHPQYAGVNFVKRIAAIGGDRVAVRGGVLFVNGQSTQREAQGTETFIYHHETLARRIEVPVRRFREQIGEVYFESYRHAETGVDSEFGESPGDYPRDGVCGYEQMPIPLRPDGDGACVVPPGSVFLLGDNRDDSLDSRQFGAVSVSAVLGRVTGIWFSRQPGGSIRWDRIGSRPLALLLDNGPVGGAGVDPAVLVREAVRLNVVRYVGVGLNVEQLHVGVAARAHNQHWALGLADHTF